MLQLFKSKYVLFFLILKDLVVELHSFVNAFSGVQ